jgi:hypothetical protein
VSPLPEGELPAREKSTTLPTCSLHSSGGPAPSCRPVFSRPLPPCFPLRRGVRIRNAMMRVFNFVVDYYETHHDFPTFHQIGQACQISRRNVSKYLDLLQEQGLIELPVAIA